MRTWEIIPCFGEFEKRLLEEYEIFALDASYGTGDFSMDRVNDRLRDFMEKNAGKEVKGLAACALSPGSWNFRRARFWSTLS